MAKFIIRLDDACEKMNIDRWAKMEALLDKYEIRPLVGVIPNCEDEQMNEYAVDTSFWDKVGGWIEKGWTVAMHGYNHVYGTECGGINPVNKRSEFAGEPLDVQKQKIRLGMEVFKAHGIEPKVFFAPSHTFDENTLSALREESNIKIISDTVANDVYFESGFNFVPQQSGRVRKLPFKTVTFCYHPNTMKDSDFEYLESFIIKNRNNFIEFPLGDTSRRKGIFDKMLEKMYFARR